MSFSVSDTTELDSRASLFGLKRYTLAFPSSSLQDRRQVPGRAHTDWVQLAPAPRRAGVLGQEP